jgi:predicted nucleic-acid-binding Zn-ribbon protein
MGDYLILRKFESYFTCPKCKESSTGLEMQWCTGGASEGVCTDLPSGYEHLHVTCGRCSYSWLSETADADERRSTGQASAHGTLCTSHTPHAPATAEELTIAED